MKPILVLLLILYATLLFGQKKTLYERFGQRKTPKERKREKLYQSEIDTFLIKQFGVERFNSYCSFAYLYFYSKNGVIHTYPKSILDSSITNIIASYFITIPEIYYDSVVDVEIDKKLNRTFLVRPEIIPKYILNQEHCNLLDTNDLKKIMGFIGIRVEMAHVSSGFDVTLDEMMFRITEHIPSNYTYDMYLINAKNGELLEQNCDQIYYYID